MMTGRVREDQMDYFHQVVWMRDKEIANQAYDRLRDEFGEHWLGYRNDRMPIMEIFRGEVTPLPKKVRERLYYRNI